MWAMHHYCVALVHMMRAEKLTTPKRSRDYHWSEVISEIDYVVQRAEPNFVLLPELYKNRARALFKLGKIVEGEEMCRRALSAKPDYWPAYIEWADALVQAGRSADARKVLEEGLQRSSDPRPIRARLAELDRQAGVRKP